MLFTYEIYRKQKGIVKSGWNFIKEKNLSYSLSDFLEESLPSGHDWYAAEAVSSGNDVYVLLQRSLYQLIWNGTRFTWQKTDHDLDDFGAYPVTMVLPNEYSCKGKLPMSLLGAEYMPLPLYLPYFDWGEINLPLPVKHSGFIKVIHGLQGF